MLYTSYIANIKNIPDDYYKLVITRYPPKNMSFDSDLPVEDRKICLGKILAPKREILLDYKKDNDWYKYKERYLNQLDNKRVNKYLSDLIDFTIHFNRLVLLCYEKDHTKCHRNLLGNYINKKYGIAVEEL